LSKGIEITRGPLALKPITLERFMNLPERDPQQEAQASARRIIEKAYLEAESLKKAAYEEGYRAGFEKGKEEGLNELRKAVEKLEELFVNLSSEVSKRKEELFENIEAEMVELVIALTEKVVCKEVENKEAIENIVRKALQLVGEEKKIVVHLHPDDLDLIKGNGFKGNGSSLDLIPDEGIIKGGCIIEAGKKVVDARLETRLEEMVEVLYGRR